VEARDEAPSDQVAYVACEAMPGSELFGLGASQGRETPREIAWKEGGAIVRKAGASSGNAVEVLEGERKAKSGVTPDGQPHRELFAGRRQGPGRKAKGRRRSREANRPATASSQTLKVNATPRRVRQ
jgi:hypothetical protein